MTTFNDSGVIAEEELVLRYPDHTNNAEVSTEDIEVEICEDCIYRGSGIEVEGIELGDDRYDTCPEWDLWGFNFTYPEDDPDGYGEPVHGFSKSECDGCHTTLYGERYTMTAVYLGGAR